MTFSDVVGQRHITDTLKKQIETNRLSHAYLFTGTRGTGKTTCAKILAKAANCLDPKGGEPCNECFSCVGINNGSIIDISEIDAASYTGVDNIRQIRECPSQNPRRASSPCSLYSGDYRAPQDPGDHPFPLPDLYFQEAPAGRHRNEAP
jgi:DNA polymerase III subunit gamma/tau